MTNKLHLWVDMACRLRRVLRPVEDHDLAVDTHRGNEVLILRHVTRFVDFSLVINLLNNLELWLESPCRVVAANLPALCIVVVRISGRGRQAELSNLKIVWGAIRCVSTHQQSMRLVAAVFGSTKYQQTRLVVCLISLYLLVDVSKPLCSKCRPVKRLPKIAMSRRTT